MEEEEERVLKKRILSVILALSLVMAMCIGCSSSSGKSESSSKGGEEIDYPTKEITLIVPWASGGSTDTICRKLASVMEKELGQSIVVMNTEGAGGAVGFKSLVGAKADGYTVGAVTGTMILNQYFLDDAIPYDDVYNLAVFNTNASCLAVPADSPFDTLQDFIDYAKEHPGEVRVANAGIGTTWHGVAATLADKAGIELNHVPYDGGNPAVTAAAGGHVEGVVCAVSEAYTLVSSGNLKYLAISDESVLAPDIPTFEEQGVEGMFGSYIGLAAPKDVPEEIAQKFIESMKNAYESDEMVEFMEEGGYGRTWMTGDELKTYMEEMDESFSKIPTE